MSSLNQCWKTFISGLSGQCKQSGVDWQLKSFDDIYLQNVVFDAGLKEVEAIIKVFINSTHLTFSDMCVTCVFTLLLRDWYEIWAPSQKRNPYFGASMVSNKFWISGTYFQVGKKICSSGKIDRRTADLVISKSHISYQPLQWRWTAVMSGRTMLFHSLLNNIIFSVSKEVSGKERKWSDSGPMKILCCWFWWVDKARCQAPIYWLLRDGHFPQATSSCCEIMWIMGTRERLSWWRGLLSTSCGWLSIGERGGLTLSVVVHV